MEGIETVLWLLSWPVFIFACYQLAKFMIKKTNLLSSTDEPEQV